MAPADPTEKTYRLECRRAISSGILESAAHTFLLLIAVSHFQAGSLAKALVAGGGSLGLLVSPALISLIRRMQWKTGSTAAWISLLGAGGFLGMTVLPVLPAFVVGSILALTASSVVIPLVTQIYQENYPPPQRGRRFSRTALIRIVVVALFSQLAGSFLGWDMNRYPWLLTVFALAFINSAHCFSQLPAHSLARLPGSHPFRSFLFVRRDPVFRRTLLSWMLMGFANLIMFPMRVEYLANPRYGLDFEVTVIALVVGVIPSLMRLLATPVWGRWFDRMNFFTLRLLLNLGFVLGISVFFFSRSLAVMIMGAALFGLATAGGEVAWNLWVTKLAPPSRVADYMAVHTFLTGVRGLLAPLTGFLLLNWISMQWLAAACVMVILYASLLLLPMLTHGGAMDCRQGDTKGESFKP